MIRVEISVLPAGDADRARLLAVLEMENVAQLADVSDYSWRYRDLAGGWSARGGVHGHRRADGLVPLLRRAFEGLER